MDWIYFRTITIAEVQNVPIQNLWNLNKGVYTKCNCLQCFNWMFESTTSAREHWMQGPSSLAFCAKKIAACYCHVNLSC